MHVSKHTFQHSPCQHGVNSDDTVDVVVLEELIKAALLLKIVHVLREPDAVHAGIEVAPLSPTNGQFDKKTS